MTGHLPEHDPWADPAGGWGPPGTADAAPGVDDADPDFSGPEPQPVGEVVADVVAGLSVTAPGDLRPDTPALLAAIAAAWSMDIAPDLIVAGIKTFDYTPAAAATAA